MEIFTSTETIVCSDVQGYDYVACPIHLGRYPLNIFRIKIVLNIQHFFVKIWLYSIVGSLAKVLKKLKDFKLS